MATSPGKLGGLRGLTHVRAILGNIGVYVLPDQRAIPSAQESFSPDGTLNDAQENQAILTLGAKLVEFTQKLHSDLNH